MNVDVAFCRKLLALTMQDIRKVTTAAERKGAWVYGYGSDNWEFHGPDGFYWWGYAANAYDARSKGWSAWWAKLEQDAAAMQARLAGEAKRSANAT